MYYIYILECSNGAYYTGYTTDIVRRYQEHRVGSSKCKYTRSFPPRAIAACWQAVHSLSDVLKVEKFIKNLPRKRKLAIIYNPALLNDELQKNYPGQFNELNHYTLNI